ncbi:hypothetical protein B7P34_35185, partial [Streptosporangium nondiastaticum]
MGSYLRRVTITRIRTFAAFPRGQSPAPPTAAPRRARGSATPRRRAGPERLREVILCELHPLERPAPRHTAPSRGARRPQGPHRRPRTARARGRRL